MVVFAAYVAVALGLGGSGLLAAFSDWVSIGLVLGAAGLLAVRGLTADGGRAPWFTLRGRGRAVGGRRADLPNRLRRRA